MSDAIVDGAPYKVDFLRFAWHHSRNITDDSTEANYRDAFSACWWQSVSDFLAVPDLAKMTGSPEGASFDVLIHHSDRVRMTRDWLDLGVEHMSKWWRLALDHNDAVPSTVEKIVNIFQRYTYSTDRLIFYEHMVRAGDTAERQIAREVTSSTLAVIAYMPDNEQEITVWSLASTIMSLIQVGIGRVVVSGHQETDRELVAKAFSHVKHATRDWDDGDAVASRVDFCISANATTGIQDTIYNVPKAVMKRLRQVLLDPRVDLQKRSKRRVGSESLDCWLGKGVKSDPDRWKYVFLAEPDTVLATKPHALPGLTEALRGGAVLAPHRYQPLPHASDFAGVSGMGKKANVLPSVSPFRDVVEIDSFSRTRSNSCCDRGKFKPFLLHEDCGSFWWMCGYLAMQNPENVPIIEGEGDSGRELTQLIVAHKRLLGYTLVRNKRGMGVVFASSESGKTCAPKTGQCVDDNQ